MKYELPIIYRDEHVVVLDKPSGLLAVPGRGPELQDCLSARVLRELPTALVVHRLDRDTSGVLLMALTPDAQRALSRQFELRAVEKRYHAIVHGCPCEASGVIELPLRKDFDRPPRHMVDPELGRPAVTGYQVLEPGAGRSRVELAPLTGRSHQLRVHLAAIGHPILGDPLYADEAVQRLAPRLMLHAQSLALVHPASSEPMRWCAPLPF
jgi:tRNA pseudouridine32 synthase/23S rRNA pseudouridine746 synthase